MDNKIYPIVLDIKKNRENTDIELVQYDNGTSIFDITLSDGMNDYNIGASIIEASIRKPDGKIVILEADNISSAGDNRILVTLTAQVLASAGKAYAEIVFKDGERTLTTTRFGFHIREAINNDNAIESTDEYKALDKLVQQAEELSKEIEEAIKSLDNVDELKKELADINEKIITAKDEIDKQITEANDTIKTLISAISNTKLILAELEAKQVDIENLKGLLIKVDELSTSLSNLDASIASAKKIKGELDTSITTATDKVTALDAGNETATSNIISLGEVNTTAKATEKSLKATDTKATGLDTELSTKIESGIALSTELDKKITDGSGVRESLVTSTAEANTSKTTLDASVKTAKAINIELDNTNTTAVGTNTTLGTTLVDAKETESKLLEIIAQGDLAKYITDEKLRAELLDYVTETGLTTKLADYLKSVEAEKTYATKTELEAIDVSGQLVDYEKTVEVDKKITEINTAIGKKSDTVTVNAELEKKANKIYVDAELGKKSSITYVDTALEKKASIDYVTETLHTAIEQLVDNAPEALNTLKELSDALGNDANFANTIATEIGTKVDKKIGYGLTPNEYTDADKLKVANIPANPQYTDTKYDTQIAAKMDKTGGKFTGQVVMTPSALGTPQAINTVVLKEGVSAVNVPNNTFIVRVE